MVHSTEQVKSSMLPDNLNYKFILPHPFSVLYLTTTQAVENLNYPLGMACTTVIQIQYQTTLRTDCVHSPFCVLLGSSNIHVLKYANAEPSHHAHSCKTSTSHVTACRVTALISKQIQLQSETSIVPGAQRSTSSNTNTCLITIYDTQTLDVLGGCTLYRMYSFGTLPPTSH